MQAQLPLYQCHKQVHALKLARVTYSNPCAEDPFGKRGVLIPSDNAFAPIFVSAEYMEKNDPKAGGYYVVYADGYESYSPAHAFEEGYTPISDGATQEPVMDEVSMRFNVLSMANTPAFVAEEVVKRAGLYLAFVKGEEAGDP
jgi:hypothetical protein